MPLAIDAVLASILVFASLALAYRTVFFSFSCYRNLEFYSRCLLSSKASLKIVFAVRLVLA